MFLINFKLKNGLDRKEIETGLGAHVKVMEQTQGKYRRVYRYFSEGKVGCK